MAQGLLNVLVKQAQINASDTKPFDVVDRNLYGIEALARRQLLETVKLQQRHKRFLKKHGRSYAPLSLEPLRSWRTPQGWPKLAIFSLNTPKFSISADVTQERTRKNVVDIIPILPLPLEQCYADVAQNLLDRSRRMEPRAWSNRDASCRVTLTAEFTGVIPPHAKKEIAHASAFFQDIFVIAEPVRWSLKLPARLPADPLIVGWDGEGLYLIAEFDTSPVEEALMLEGPANKRK